MAESTFDYILPKAALKGSIQRPLLCLFSHNQEWLLFANDKFNFFFYTTPDTLSGKMSYISRFEYAEFDFEGFLDENVVVLKCLIIQRHILIPSLKFSSL